MPLKEGVVLPVGVVIAFRVTVGGFVFTTNVTTLDLPSGLPSGLSWVAWAAKVRLPLGRAGPASPVVNAAPVPLTVALASWVPSALVPS